MYEPAHPAVLRMIEMTGAAAKAAKIPCGICGEMAGDPLFTELLLGLGVNSFSMSAVALPMVRAEIMNIRLPLARRFAKRVLKAGTVAEVRDMLVQRYRRRGSSQQYVTAQLTPYQESGKI